MGNVSSQAIAEAGELHLVTERLVHVIVTGSVGAADGALGFALLAGVVAAELSARSRSVCHCAELSEEPPPAVSRPRKKMPIVQPIRRTTRPASSGVELASLPFARLNGIGLGIGLGSEASSVFR